jgi:hypothetical protein
MSQLWRTSFKAFVDSITTAQARDGRWEINWGAAPEFGDWYDAVRMAALANIELTNSGGRDLAASQRVQEHQRTAAEALAQLEGVEWVAEVVAISTGPDEPSQLNLPPLPDPLRLTFIVDPADAPNWSRVAPGELVRFACRFSSTEQAEYPTIVVNMTLKNVVPR